MPDTRFGACLVAAISAMLWVDKHRPDNLDTLSFHQDVTDQLRVLVCKGATMAVFGVEGIRVDVVTHSPHHIQAKADGFPHLLFHGPPG